MRKAPSLLLPLLLVAPLLACGEEAPPPESGEAAPPSGGEVVPPSGGGEPPAGRTDPQGTCGGIAGFVCPEGQWCDMEGNYPDASGVCREQGTCDEPSDCVEQDLVHAMCVGDWTCTDGQCGWECE